MASAQPRLITADEFLAIEWDSSDVKAELDNGVIRMMAGGSAAHSRVQRNVLVALDLALRGSGCSPHGSDMGVLTSNVALRYPDVSVFCGREDRDYDAAQAFDDPVMVVEVLSPSTRTRDLGLKLREYRLISSLKHILYVDPEAQTLRLLTRDDNDWMDEDFTVAPSVPLSAFGIELAWDTIFARN